MSIHTFSSSLPTHSARALVPSLEVPWVAPLSDEQLGIALPAIRHLSGLTVEKMAEILGYDRAGFQKLHAANAARLPRRLIGKLMAVSYIGAHGSFVDELKLCPSLPKSATSMALGLRLLASSYVMRPDYLIAKLPEAAEAWAEHIHDVADMNGLYVSDTPNGMEIRTFDI